MLSNEVARRLGWSPTKVSRLESGTRGSCEIDIAMYLTTCGVSRTELDRLLDLCRASDDGYWLRPHGERLPDELRSLVYQETSAATIGSFELARVPGLLQTEDYARAMITRSVSVPAGGVEMRVRARLGRQSLLQRRNPPTFTFLVHEQALRLRVGGLTVMHEQMLHLVFASSRPHCAVRVVPDSAGAHAGLAGPFKLIQYSGHPPAVYVENEVASLFLERPADIATYRRAFTRLAEVALDEGQSREFLARLASEYDRVEVDRDEYPDQHRA